MRIRPLEPPDAMPLPFCVKSSQDPRELYYAHRLGDDARIITAADMITVAQSPSHGASLFYVANAKRNPPVHYAVAVLRTPRQAG